jgi:hypothetical protein
MDHVGSMIKFGLPIVKTLFGMGDYAVSNETNKNSLFSGQNYEFSKGPVMIRHREYIGDIITSPTASTFNY